MRFLRRYLLHVLIIFSILSSCTANNEKAEERAAAAKDAAIAKSIQTPSQRSVTAMDSATASTYIYMDSLDVQKAGMRVIYPIERENKAEGKRPKLSSEPDRGGSFVSFDFFLSFPRNRIMFQEILFHSVASCSSFAKKLNEESYIDDADGGFPEDWHSPKNFAEQKAAFESQSLSGKYEFLKLRDENYLIDCWYSEPSGSYIFEAITFKGDTRIIIAMAGRKKCEDDYQNYLNLLSRFKLLPLKN